MWDKDGTLSFCMCISSCPMLKRLSFLIELPWHLFWKMTINVRLFLDDLFVSLLYMSTHMPVPHCLEYNRFVVSFEIGKWKSSNFILFFHNCLLNSRSSAFSYKFHINFRISLLISTKNTCWGFDKGCVESVDQFGEICRLKNIEPPHPWTWAMSPFI